MKYAGAEGTAEHPMKYTGESEETAEHPMKHTGEAEETAGRYCPEIISPESGQTGHDEPRPLRREDILRPSEREAHWYLDLWRLNREILLSAGLREEHIFCMGISTLKYPGLFFSHRRSGGRRGLNVGIIALSP